MTEIESPAAATPEADRKRGKAAWIGKVLLAVIALAVLVLAGRQLGGYVPRFAQWVETLGLWGPLVFILGYAAATVAFVPGSLLTLAAGAIFGLLEGTVYVFNNLLMNLIADRALGLPKKK